MSKRKEVMEIVVEWAKNSGNPQLENGDFSSVSARELCEIVHELETCTLYQSFWMEALVPLADTEFEWREEDGVVALYYFSKKIGKSIMIELNPEIPKFQGVWEVADFIVSMSEKIAEFESRLSIREQPIPEKKMLESKIKIVQYLTEEEKNAV